MPNFLTFGPFWQFSVIVKQFSDKALQLSGISREFGSRLGQFAVYSPAGLDCTLYVLSRLQWTTSRIDPRSRPERLALIHGSYLFFIYCSMHCSITLLYVYFAKVELISRLGCFSRPHYPFLYLKTLTGTYSYIFLRWIAAPGHIWSYYICPYLASWSTGKFSDCALRFLGFESGRGPGPDNSAFHSEKNGNE